MGSSSSFSVGLLNALSAFNGTYVGDRSLAERVIHIEQNIIKEHVGSQDQISAAFGGFNEIDFFRDGEFSVSPLIVRPERLIELNNHLMLFFSGISRFSSEIAESQILNIKSLQVDVSIFYDMVNEGIAILKSDNAPIQDFGCLLHESWKHKRMLSDRITNSQIDTLYDLARRAGALGGKVLGAGGGGFMLFFVNPEDQPKVKESLSGLTYVPFQFENTGSKVVLYQPDGFRI